VGLPELEVARVRKWCHARVPEHLHDQVRVECDVTDRHLTIVTIVEVRPPWDGVGEHTRFPVARLSYVGTRRVWSLYWRDRNGRFHAYDDVQPSRSVEPLLDEIERDPMAIFWG
jgi:hypothetical protein